VITEGKALAHDDSFDAQLLVALLAPPTMVETEVWATRNKC